MDARSGRILTTHAGSLPGGEKLAALLVAEEKGEAVGDRERVIAGSDCGFSTFAGTEFSVEDIVWAKLQALVDGAALASERLW